MTIFVSGRESQCPKLAADSYMTKDDLESGAHLPCKAFFKVAKARGSKAGL